AEQPRLASLAEQLFGPQHVHVLGAADGAEIGERPDEQRVESRGRATGGGLQDDAGDHQANRGAQLRAARRLAVAPHLLKLVWRCGFGSFAAHWKTAIETPIMPLKTAWR